MAPFLFASPSSSSFPPSLTFWPQLVCLTSLFFSEVEVKSEQTLTAEVEKCTYSYTQLYQSEHATEEKRRKKIIATPRYWSFRCTSESKVGYVFGERGRGSLEKILFHVLWFLSYPPPDFLRGEMTSVHLSFNHPFRWERRKKEDWLKKRG